MGVNSEAKVIRVRRVNNDERVIFGRKLFNNLDELYQSAYKELHGMETALLKVQNDIRCAIDNYECVLLVLLDLYPVFDIINDQTLLTCLEKQLGIKGSVHDWFHSYLSNRTQSVLIDGVLSDPVELLFGVPQGSVLGHLLVTIYTSTLGQML